MQMRDPHQGLRSHRRTQFYIREAAENDANLVDRLSRLQRDQLQWGNFYGHMFTEDAEQILPWGTTLTAASPFRLSPTTARSRI
jgi:hypothetical protein